MDCPRCKKPMVEVEEDGVKLDVCKSSCGGIWFDNYELKKLDESHEVSENFYNKIAPDDSVTSVNIDDRLNCPKCDGIVLMRNFFSVKKEVEVDHCGNCGGYWLDVHELTSIHKQFKTEADRKKAAESALGAVIAPSLSKMKTESDEKLKGARKISNALRFICPSYYIKGKQDWGAF